MKEKKTPVHEFVMMVGLIVALSFFALGHAYKQGDVCDDHRLTVLAITMFLCAMGAFPLSGNHPAGLVHVGGLFYAGLRSLGTGFSITQRIVALAPVLTIASLVGFVVLYKIDRQYGLPFLLLITIAFYIVLYFGNVEVALLTAAFFGALAFLSDFIPTLDSKGKEP